MVESQKRDESSVESDILDKLEPTIFADDTTMVTYAKEMKTLEKVANDELEKVARWFRKNKLTLNVNKTNYVIFSHETRHSVNTIIRICIDGEQILRKSTTSSRSHFSTLTTF